jgi:hypothetical protein
MERSKILLEVLPDNGEPQRGSAEAPLEAQCDFAEDWWIFVLPKR